VERLFLGKNLLEEEKKNAESHLRIFFPSGRKCFGPGMERWIRICDRVDTLCPVINTPEPEKEHYSG
jgi:hypothetical protein